MVVKQSESREVPNVTIPKWFVWFLSGVLTIITGIMGYGLTWAMSLSTDVAAIKQQIQGIGTLHASELENVRQRLDSHEQDINKIDDRVRSLERNGHARNDRNVPTAG